MSELELRGVSVRVQKRELVKDVSLKLEAGGFVALVGPNGAGKTTLLRAALGLVTPSTGQVLLAGQDVRHMKPKERADHVAWLPQHAGSSEPLSALEAVMAARYRFFEAQSASERAARLALERVGMGAHSAARITELSGGERQRIAVATLLAQAARVALLDEPANHLDPAQQLETYRLLGELWSEGMGILLVTHDLNLLSQLGAADRIQVVGLADGRVHFTSSYAAPNLPARLGELFGVEFAAIERAGRRMLLATLP
jgi:iron complex transport system ATP-binding protein